MSEWISVLAVFWALWALDGLRILPRAAFTVMGGNLLYASLRGRRNSTNHSADRTVARIHYSRLSSPGILPASWRMVAGDVPLALSPQGVCNVVVGAAGRPAERPRTLRTWRWEEIRHVGVAGGWIFVNGEGFCPDSGHLKAAELLALVRLDSNVRQAKIENLIRRWFRPVHLRRCVTLLKARTALPTLLNTITFAALVALSAYVVGDIASRLPASWSERLVETAPWLLLGLLATHLAAVILAWRVKRKLRVVTGDKRGAALFSALLLPPQALRLRATLSDGFFPAQHPLAAILAFGDRRSREEHAFNALADLRWPIHEPKDVSSPTSEVVAWFRNCLEHRLVEQLAQAGISTGMLFAPPTPDSPASCRYCPRCRDQFLGEARICPNGVGLRPLTAPDAHDSR